MDSILVTGGAGFIGAHFVKEMLDHHVVVLDKLTYAGDKNRLSSIITQIDFIKGDICDALLLEQLFEKHHFKYVINFAAESHVDRSILNATEFIRTNVMGVQILMDVCMKYFDSDQIFLQVSTDEVYGPYHGMVFNEQSPLNPKNPYAASKASAEHLIKAYENTYQFPNIITRSTNNYGADQHNEKLIPKVIDAILNHNDIKLYGDGQHRRSWLHVKDHVRILRQILMTSHPNQIYNIAGHDNISNLEMANQLIELFSDLEYDYNGSIVFVEDRKGHDLNYIISDNKVDSNRRVMSEGLKAMVIKKLASKL